MSHFSQDEIIAFHLGESQHEAAVRVHLEVCDACAEISYSVAETLRVFSAGRVPHTDFETSWQRVRSSMGVLAAPGRRSWRTRLAWPAVASLCAVMLLAIFFIHRHNARMQNAHYAFDRPGPLTTVPVDERNHLDAAERLLTEVNHTHGDLDDATLDAAHQLALSNAIYVQQAQQRGDMAEAATLEHLGRVLTDIGHQPKENAQTWRLRLEMNTDGLLLDIRILQQNDDH
ncbi:MAG: hypothetical protein JSS87_05555 [Acidobacteria bacterium]|nr:hypothetical protein [Acidobacteriota bacterium]